MRRRLCHPFPGSGNHGNSIAYRNFITWASSHITQNPGGRRFYLNRRFVRLDLHQRLALGNRLPLALEPVDKRSFFLRYSKRRHNYIGGQISSLLRLEHIERLAR
jgi:hypothetical protein